jgi:hypothetical protein
MTKKKAANEVKRKCRKDGMDERGMKGGQRDSLSLKKETRKGEKRGHHIDIKNIEQSLKIIVTGSKAWKGTVIGQHWTLVHLASTPPPHQPKKLCQLAPR